MKNFNFGPIANIAKDVCTVVAYGAALALPYVIKEMIKREIDNQPVGYSEVAKTIMESSMLSSYKHEAMIALKPDADDRYYKTVIYIVNSSMLGSDKVKMVQDLSK